MRNNKFINITLGRTKLDLYIIRTSIENSIKTILPRLKGTLLDLGCGHMPYKPLFTSEQTAVTKYIGLDLEDNPIHKNKPDITWKEDKIPLDDETIDCAIATEVFEHCPDLKKVMSEINRVLKPDSLLFFTVPFFWPLHEVPYDEYRYTPFSLNRILMDSGFSNIELKPLGGWDASLAQMLGLWARRRPMNKWNRLFLSVLLMPFVSLLYRSDKKLNTKFIESAMITGLSGTALKSNDHVKLRYEYH
jgi:SAM-dependent methyltransferase